MKGKFRGQVVLWDQNRMPQAMRLTVLRNLAGLAALAKGVPGGSE
jgi:hypothetical protein